MVSKNYLAPHAEPSSAAKTYFDQKVIPAGINVVAAVESATLRLGQAASRAPVAAMFAAILLGATISVVIAASRPRRAAARISWRM